MKTGSGFAFLERNSRRPSLSREGRSFATPFSARLFLGLGKVINTCAKAWCAILLSLRPCD